MINLSSGITVIGLKASIETTLLMIPVPISCVGVIFYIFFLNGEQKKRKLFIS